MKTAPWIIISVLIGLLFFQRECHRCPKAEPCPEQDTITTITVMPGESMPQEKPKVIIQKYDSIVYKEVPANIDSAAVARAYYAQTYGYTVMVDNSTLYVGFDWMVEQNTLQYTIPKIANRKPTAIIHNTSIIESVKPRNKYFAGIGVGRSLNSFALAPSLALLIKKDHLYSFSYDLLNKDMYFTMYWKIGKK